MIRLSGLLALLLMFSAPVQADVKTKDTAPPITLKDLDGKDFDLAAALKNGPVAVNFWASWCTSCAEEVPQLEELQKTYPKLQCVGINMGESRVKAERFLRRAHYPWRALLDESETVSKAYGIDSLPTTLVIGSDGVVLFRGSRPPKDPLKI